MKHFCSLSSAIRAGIPLSPQTTCELQNESGATCAIGAGLRAIGMFYRCTMFALEQLAEIYPYMRDEATCPACEHHVDEVGWIAICLNDAHFWSRERVADWLQDYEDSIGFVTLSEPSEEIDSSINSFVVEVVGV